MNSSALDSQKGSIPKIVAAGPLMPLFPLRAGSLCARRLLVKLPAKAELPRTRSQESVYGRGRDP
jgi:hypothetical protein